METVVMMDEFAAQKAGIYQAPVSVKISEGLLRQRRNLIILSCLLIFLKYSKVMISNLSIVGIQFSSFDNPDAIYIAIWIVWGYFLWRFFQYSFQEGWLNFVLEYKRELNIKSVAVIRRVVLEYYPNSNDRKVDIDLLKGWGWEYSGQEESQGKDSITGLVNFSFPFPRKRLWRLRVCNFLQLIVFRSAFTDYLFPFALAFYAVYYCFDHWPGSLLSSIVVLWN